MPSPDASPALLQILCDTARRSHEEIDAALSLIDLANQQGYARLAAHRIGIAAIFPVFEEFAPG